MAFSTVPTHGKLGALYVLRPNGFNGVGLNDLTWAYNYTGAASGEFEVVIDGEGTGVGAVDEFKWRKNGGAWTEHVDISGAAQVLSDTQSLTFAATTGHTLGDKWFIGNLAAEATTENGATAQITDATKRLLNPNLPTGLTFTDDGGKTVTAINYTNGTATFTAAVGNVTVAGLGDYIPSGALQKVAYLTDWSLSLSLDLADSTPMGSHWKTALPGLAGGSGSAGGYFVATQTLWNCLAESIAAGDKYFLLQLFTWDPDQDQTGDHYTAWVTFNSFAIAPTISAVVKEALNFQVHGEISLTANA